VPLSLEALNVVSLAPPAGLADNGENVVTDTQPEGRSPFPGAPK
jgi:hypothetical protein